MTDFLDSSFEVNGKKYFLTLTEWDARKLLEIGFNVYDFFQDEESLKAVFDRSKLLADVLVYCCNVDDVEKFMRALTPGVLNQAREALKNAIVNFSPANNKAVTLELFSATEKALTNPQILDLDST